MNTSEYLSIIENIKSEIKAAQYRAAVHANVDMLLLYHDIGCVINEHNHGATSLLTILPLILGSHSRRVKDILFVI